MNENPLGLAIPSKRFDVWSRLYARYLLEPHPAGVGVGVQPVIQPITDSDRLLQVPEVRVATVSIDSQAGFVMFAVPDGERWLMMFNRMRVSGGTWTHNNISLRPPGGDLIQISEYSASSGSVIFEPQTPFLIDQAWDIIVNVNDFTSTGNGVMQVYILVESAF